MDRRQFVARGSLAAAAWALRPRRVLAVGRGRGSVEASPQHTFLSDDARLMRVYEAALVMLAGNIVEFPMHPHHPVLVEGSVYHGVWMECAPQEGEVWDAVGPAAARDAARNNHLIFFALQKEDGQLPYSVKSTGAGFSQIQMVVPVAATAWELARRWGDSELLEKAYSACGQWDAWLRQYRNTRGTGLCEGFCTYDTGQDNSPRWKGIPNACPDRDARKCPQAPGLPRLCPDLSATVYGGRVALAAMAKALGKSTEADRWTEDAETLRRLILDKLYDPHDGAFYDLDADNRFVRIRSSTILSVLGEHVPGADVFEAVWSRQVHNPHAFWSPYPFPSVALDDPQFVRPIPRNSWGGATQALTALRAPRWMEHYAKPAQLGTLMIQWTTAVRRASDQLFHRKEDLTQAFRQQFDPLNGDFTQADPGGYSPAALVFLDFLWRLSGVREPDPDGPGFLEWNVRPPAAHGHSRFTAQLKTGAADLSYDGQHANLRLAGKLIAQVSGTVRLISSPAGELQVAVGIAEGERRVKLRVPGRPARTLGIRANQRIDLATPAG